MIYSAFTRNRNHQEDITFDTIQRCIGSVDTFTLFCELTIFKTNEGASLNSIHFVKALKWIQKLLKNHPHIKLVRPLKTLCLRLIEANEGLSVLHSRFLELCYTQNLPREALGIMKSKALPKKMGKPQYAEFSRLSGLIYIQLDDYSNAYLKFKQTVDDISADSRNRTDNIKKLILLSLIVGIKESVETIKGISQSLRFINESNYENPHLRMVRPQSDMPVYISLLQGQTPSQISTFREDNHLQLLTLISLPKISSLRTYLVSQIVQNNYRMRASEIQQISLLNFKNIKALNYPKPIYKYDFKGGFAYFRVSQSYENDCLKVSEDVSQCMAQYLEVVRNKGGEKVDKPDRMGSSGIMGFGGMGALGNLLGRLNSK